jgi:hypothetical protein
VLNQRSVISRVCFEPNFKKIYFFFLASCFALFQRSVKSLIEIPWALKKIFFFFLVSCFALFQQSVKSQVEIFQAQFWTNAPFSTYFVVFTKEVWNRGEPNFKKNIFFFKALCFALNQRSVKPRVEILWAQFKKNIFLIFSFMFCVVSKKRWIAGWT